MSRLLLFALLPVALCAQAPADLFNKPPTEVDAALRARITEFLQYHVKQQFRQAEALVAEDTKDFFYSHNKPQYLTFEITRIEYSKDFTHAKATIVVEQFVMMPGFTDKPMKIPQPSTWKLEGGKWCWYVDPESIRETPFGKMNPGAGTTPRGLPTVLPTSADFALGKVKADKASITLRPGDSQQVKVTNTAPGIMDLTLVGFPQGIDAKLDRTTLKANETAVLTLQAGKDPRYGNVDLRVEQTLEFVTIEVVIK